MASHPEDVPPPPYTETDFFSVSGRDPHRDETTTTTSGEVIYTPPLTPRSSYQSNVAGEVDHLANSPAAAYFATRPAPHFTIQPYIVHSITIRDDSTPDSLPYPSSLAARDVRPEDWQTFVNYLMPHYYAATNEKIVDRKLRAEGLAADNNDDVGPAQSPSRVHAEAQLNQIRSPVDIDAAQRRQAIEATVREWNDGFFGPRRVTVRVDFPLPGNDMNDVPPEPYVPDARDRQQPSGQEHNAAGPSTSRPRFGLFGPFCGDRGDGFRWRGINVEGDRVSIGDTFVADGRNESLRIGGVVMDSNGISINGRQVFGGRCGRGPGPWGPRGWGMGAGHWGPPGGWPFGGAPDAWRGCGRSRRATWGWGAGRWNSHPAGSPQGRDGDEGERGRGLWGHDHPHSREHRRSRSSSVSSSSSSSTSSSSDSSDSSVGSLPDYDDLRDAQLPMAKQCLEEWLHHPEQPITKERVKQIKQQIKQAKHASDPAKMAFDKAALRKEVKELLRQWRELKKQQKRQRKQLRRERRQRRKEEKRERREMKREMKRAAREQRWEERYRAALERVMPPPPPPPPPPFYPVAPSRDLDPNHPHSAPPVSGFPHSPFDPFSAPGGGEEDGARGGGGDSKAKHAASRAKYRAVAEAEERLEQKEAELFALHERIAEERSARGGGETSLSKAEVEALAVEREIDELGKTLERLRTEADEEFARELAEEEVQRTRY